MKTWLAYALALAIPAMTNGQSRGQQLTAESLVADEVLFPQILVPSHDEFTLDAGGRTTANTVRLGPNGIDTARWTVTVKDEHGEPVPGVQVRFGVQAVYPLGWWRDPAQVRARYGRATGWRGKRLIGTVAPTRVRTDSSGQAVTVYTSSHVGGDDPSRSGEERLIATLPNGQTVTAAVLIGYTHLRSVKEVASGLRFTSGAAGRFLHRDLAAFFERIGTEISAAKWPHPLSLTDGAYPWGGMIPPHAGHLHGMTVDCRPMSVDGQPTSAGNAQCPKAANHAANYDRPRTQIVASALSGSNATMILFNDAKITVTSCAPSHHHHLHATWLERRRVLADNPQIDPMQRSVAASVRPLFTRSPAVNRSLRVDTPHPMTLAQRWAVLRAAGFGFDEPFEAEIASWPEDRLVDIGPSRPVTPGKLGLGAKIYTRARADAEPLYRDLERDGYALTAMSRGTGDFVLRDPGPDVSMRLLRDGEVIFIGEVPVPDIGDEMFARLNEDAADTHQVREAMFAHGLSGENVDIGVWDGGGVRHSHQELVGRATQLDAPPGLSDHATHVAGTIAALGNPNPDARGMAPQADLHCHDWTDDATELAAAAVNGVVCTNHSYGAIRGWHHHSTFGWMWWGSPEVDPQEDYHFGKYNGESFTFDQVVYGNPTLSILVAAGNDRNDEPPSQPIDHWVRTDGDWQRSSTIRLGDGWDQGGFDTIDGMAAAKNVITIGAIHDMVDEPPTPEAIRVTGFSNWGPADDGRVKPDLVANGWQLLSTSATADDAYTQMSGTSMATPAATGIVGLLAELFERHRGRSPFADETKAALIHTAMSPHEGPDYRIGWGSIRADRASDLVAGEAGLLLRETIDDADFEWRGEATGEDVRVTLVWIDPPGQPNVGGLDDPQTALINDLDLVLEAPDGTPHGAWVLDPAHPLIPATRGTNHADNVERVDVSAPAAGESWRVVVRNAGAFQPFALAISGLEGASDDPSQTGKR